MDPLTDEGMESLYRIQDIGHLQATPQYQILVKWMLDHHVPIPFLRLDETSNGKVIQFHFIHPVTGDPLAIYASDFMHSPAVAVSDLTRLGYMKDQGYLVNPDYNPPTDPEKPIAPIRPLPNEYSVGNVGHASWGDYYYNTGATPKLNQSLINDRGVFRAITYPTPFGIGAYWLKVEDPNPPAPPATSSKKVPLPVAEEKATKKAK